MVWLGSHESEVRRLEAQAFEALDAGDWDDAEALAARLIELGWSGGFEIRALAAHARGDADGAARILEEGVSRAAGAWALWHLLGIVRSDLRRYAEALDAFDHALACEGVDPTSVLFNRAVAHARRGEPAAALEDLDPILLLSRPPPFAEDALSLAAECMGAVGRAGEALGMVRASYDACAKDDPRHDRLSAELALALDRGGGDAQEVRCFFEAAAEGGVATPSFFALGRRLARVVARAPRLHRIVVQAPAPPHMRVGGVLRVFEVVADDREQALALTLPYFPPASREGAIIDEHEDRGEPPVFEAGVWWASGFVYYEEE